MRARALLLLLVVAALQGCWYALKFSYADAEIALLAGRSDTPTAVAVLDQRTYVTSGDKGENFVGLSRDGYGIPYDVKTRGRGAMAVDMATAVARALEAHGQPAGVVAVPIAAGPETAKASLMQSGAERLLLFTLREWKTDTMARTGLWFDVTLDVFDSSGELLATRHISGKEVAGGSFISAEKDAQRLFGEKMGLLLDNRDVASALK